MNLTLPVSNDNKEFIDTFLSKVKDDVNYLDRHYESVYNLLKDAMTGAMTWAPQAVMNKRVPDVQNIYNLAVQLLTICYCTERNMRKSG